MLQKKKPLPPALKESMSTANLNIISGETDIKGSLKSNSDTRLAGKLEGSMEIEGTVVITENGFVNGSIHAENINVSGSMEGDLIALKKVLLTDTAKVKGTIYAERLVVEEGAIFNGECQTGHKSEAISSKFVATSNGADEQLAEQLA